MSYEDSIRRGAEEKGGIVTERDGGLEVFDPSTGRSVWHRLGGQSEARFDRRHAEGLKDGRWVGLMNGAIAWVPWTRPVRSVVE